MECPNCRLLNPPGAITCDCGFNFDAKPVDASLAGTTISFSSSIGEAASAMVAAVGWTILVVTAAWGYARLYSWFCRSLRFSDGTTVRFTGNPKTIWFPEMVIVLIPQADK